MRTTTLFLMTALLSLRAQAPNTDDLVWQKSVHKFDRKRAEILRQVDAEGHIGPFQPTWESLKTYQVPEWYQDAKFGIFIHWGVYSVPAFGSEWYPRLMYVQGSPESSTT